MTGQEEVAAWNQYLESPEGARAMVGPADSQYLRNRLERAFDAGVKAATESMRQKMILLASAKAAKDFAELDGEK